MIKTLAESWRALSKTGNIYAGCWLIEDWHINEGWTGSSWNACFFSSSEHFPVSQHKTKQQQQSLQDVTLHHEYGHNKNSR